ncbi:MAG: alcohol dehydrogenase catalytic domain-containing protein [Planctomycetota bacterium]
MRAIVIGNEGVRFEREHQREYAGDMVPVKVLLAGICETDLQLVQGYMGFRGVPGHEFVGIAQSGNFAGQRVVSEINCACGVCELCDRALENHCPNRSVIGIYNHDGAFADEVLVPQENLLVVPESVPDEIAVFVEPLAAAYQIIEQVPFENIESAAVIGDGRLGYLIAQVLAMLDIELLVVGKHDSNLRRFRQLGIETTTLDAAAVRRFDLAVDCTGSPTGIPTAMNYLRPRGTLVLKTTVADPEGPNLASLVIDEITVVGSRCGPFDVALAALHAGEVEVESLITGRIGLEEAVNALTHPGHGKVLIEVGN